MSGVVACVLPHVLLYGNILLFSFCPPLFLAQATRKVRIPPPLEGKGKNDGAFDQPPLGGAFESVPLASTDKLIGPMLTAGNRDARI